MEDIEDGEVVEVRYRNGTIEMIARSDVRARVLSSIPAPVVFCEVSGDDMEVKKLGAS